MWFVNLLNLAGIIYLIVLSSAEKKRDEIMALDLTVITNKVTQTADAEKAAVILLTDLKARLDAAGTDPVALQALSDTLGTNTDALAAAIVANTPAA